ncbi:MAG: hypothetical protein JXA58_08695, partial [Dehalococcoidia bacterium]|nr:hypothetical protein [Dehalococcoidia bacterium]
PIRHDAPPVHASCQTAAPRRQMQFTERLHLDRIRDPPPGNMVLWRGMARLTDIHLGFTLAEDVGN